MTEYNSSTFNPKLMSMKVNTREWQGQKLPHGEWMVRPPGATEQKQAKFVPGHLCRISRPFKGKHDKDPFRSVFISFPSKVEMRGKPYEIPEAAGTVTFLKETLIPTIYQKVEGQKDNLNIPDFEAANAAKYFRKSWLKESSPGSGVWGFFASVSMQNIKDKEYGRYDVKAVMKDKSETPLTWDILETQDLLARPTGIALEVKIKDGACNIRAKLYGAKVSDMEVAQRESDAALVAAAADDATDDMADVIQQAQLKAAEAKSRVQPNLGLDPSKALLPKSPEASPGLHPVNPEQLLNH